jgi:hypothetical protein
MEPGLVKMEQSASADEAAAIAAAIERFQAETAPGPPAAEDSVSPWQRAALIEGVSAKGTVEDLEGGVRWLS